MSLDLTTVKVGDRFAEATGFRNPSAEVIMAGYNAGCHWVIAQREGFVPFLVSTDAAGSESSPDAFRMSLPDYWELIPPPPLIDPEQTYALDVVHGDLYSLKINCVPADETHRHVRITGYEVVR